jgi:hypothetical protein
LPCVRNGRDWRLLMEIRAFRFVAWLLGLLRIERHEIGRSGQPYLTRWVLLGTRFGEGRKLFLHYFHQSDYAGALHDHPWPFVSLLIWPGYFEHEGSYVQPPMIYHGGATRVWHRPLSILVRPALWRHRVEILPGRGCWTLVATGRKARSWGFWCPSGYRPWREHAAVEATGKDGCE